MSDVDKQPSAPPTEMPNAVDISVIEAYHRNRVEGLKKELGRHREESLRIEGQILESVHWLKLLQRMAVPPASPLSSSAPAQQKKEALEESIAKEE